MFTLPGTVRICCGGVVGLLGQAMLMGMIIAPTRTQNPTGSSSTQIGRSLASQITVIQGRITAIQDALVTVQTPDAYPGMEGVHPHFVVAGRSFKIDVSHARVLLPDGVQADKRPLAVGESVLVVVSGAELLAAPSPSAAHISAPQMATIIERVVQGDRVITH